MWNLLHLQRYRWYAYKLSLCSACLMYAQEELRAFLKPPVSHCIPCSHVLLGVGITSSYCFEVES